MLDNRSEYIALGKQQRKQHIVQVAQSMVLAGGADNFSMKQLSVNAGVPRATLYRYYANKYQLFSDVTLYWSADFFQRLSQQQLAKKTIGETVNAVVYEILQEASAKPALMNMVLTSLLAEDDKVGQQQILIEQVLPTLLGLVLTKRQLQQCEGAWPLLNRLLLSSLLLLTRKKETIQQSYTLLEQASQALLGNAWFQKL